MPVLTRERPVGAGAAPAAAQPRRHRWRRGVAALLAAALVMAGFGAVVETLLARGDAARHPAPGAVVEVAGERLHVMCSGRGEVTVVLEAGLVDAAVMFDPLREALDDDARVCAYDRPGHGWAGAPARSQSPFVQADVLAAAFDGPLLLVAHSLGGDVARALAHRHPHRLAGVVLLDPTNTETLASTPSWLLGLAGGLQLRLGEVAGRIGLLRAFDRVVASRLLPERAPDVVRDDAQHHLRPDVLAAGRAELRAHREVAADLDALLQPGALAALPLTVISAAGVTDADRAFHQRLAAMSDAGRHLVADRGGHHVHLDAPDLVVAAVRTALDVR